MGLYGDDDYKSYTRVSLWGDYHSRKVKPQIIKKDFRSTALNTTIYNLNVTPSALLDGRCWRIRQLHLE